MATSESDDFESADEELDHRSAKNKRISSQRSPPVVDSESDDDTECTSNPVQTTYGNTRSSKTDRSRNSPSPIYPNDKPSPDSSVIKNKENPVTLDPVDSKSDDSKSHATSEIKEPDLPVSDPIKTDVRDESNDSKTPRESLANSEASSTATADGNTEIDKSVTERERKSRRERPQRQQKQREAKSSVAKKLGSKILATDEVKAQPVVTATKDLTKEELPEGVKPPLVEECWEELDDILSKPISGSLSKWESGWDDPQKPDGVEECWEGMDEDIEIPEELKSDKKFKEVFKTDGWRDVNADLKVNSDLKVIEDDVTEEKILPVLDRLSSLGEEQDKSGGWGWGGWGVSSLINTASAGVTTLTNHMSQGLTMLEETIGAPDPEELAKIENTEASERSPPEKELPDAQSQTSFGFGNLMSGVSSITKLVESTSNKVIAGGLDTLETIGKKTMEVLQDGDPGLKKKRAFFTHDKDKPILSQMLREAKDKAETEEKTLEEKQLARKVHFESLFDDYQGLVHLEALEMLSKQCDIKIQQHMINLNADELCSMQETLEEVKELCDLGDEDEDESRETDLQERLKGACKDLGVNMTYDKLLETWEQTRLYLSTVTTAEPLPADREVFQRAISTLAQFTAFSVERFHKTAELLLVKERRSTVNEADALVQLTNILSGEVGVMANLFADQLNERVKHSEKPESINSNITTIFLEATNASSYIQDAFKLLIPVLQVGAT